MSKLVTLAVLLATYSPIPVHEAILSKLPFGDSMQIVLSDDLPPTDSGDWSAGIVYWGEGTIYLDPRVVQDDWRYAYGESVDRLDYLIAHEWAHVMLDRVLGVPDDLPESVTDPYTFRAPAWMSQIYRSEDLDTPWWEVHADCTAQVLTGYSVLGNYVGRDGCTDVQLSSALFPLLTLGDSE